MNFSVKKLPSLFGRAKELESQIDQFLDHVTEAGLIYKSAITIYLESGPCSEFEEYLQRILKVEGSADRLSKEIETKLYEQTLIPELRGDVLTLLENVDDLINQCNSNMFRFSIQTPKIDKEFHTDILRLTDTSLLCMESAVSASRSFFRDIDAVRDHVNKAMFYESEADQISTKVQRDIFASSFGLARKRHLAYFVEHIDELANTSEDIGDLLSILTIKRKI